MGLNSNIIYAVVARGTLVLTEYATASGNFITVSRVILEKIANQNNIKMSYLYDRFTFHYMTAGGLTYLCMADESFPKRIAFSFLADTQRRFEAAYRPDVIQRAVAFQMNEDFCRTLANQMTYYSKDPAADKLSQVRAQVDETKGIMVENIDKLMDRGERIELLVEKTNDLDQQAYTFQTEAKKMKWKAWLNNFKWYIIGGSVVALIILITIISIWVSV
mmetsp:Transcript_21485/g.54152  ORF Transcript_21485/g.54152 Transcript_21485/m.54152 type:complete len:219 (+) Transcript_21485:105-761(+)|eukprot:CAMPEP_0177655284 /NCGR_PEP_ID=MMETSP0447-20121125/14866_1 /TAXON_ID=0 /ORGANISM="Stygamoeba regulata, Strain BSH-02190019" /LENGTH=218 /DNA_ID=CAMNT_0019159155 /DNA_START=89 /DNA_END=745 /DNA_ORIENTATION=-